MPGWSARAADDCGRPGRVFVIWPYRSLRPSGMVALLGSVIFGFGYALIVSTGYQYWPIILAALLTTAGLAMALWCNMRSARTCEIVAVTSRVVEIESVGSPGEAPAPVQFNTCWVRVHVSSDRYVEDRITLREGRLRRTIGDCLSPEERRGLAEALKGTIDMFRRPLAVVEP